MSELLIMKTEGGYQCPHCNRNYKEKFNITNHISLCRFLQLSRREQTNEVEQLNEELPSQHELFRIIQHLSRRIDKLEKDNSKQRYQSKKVNILESLNLSPTPKLLFKAWITDYILPNVEHYMDIAYKQNLVESITLLFDDILTRQGKDDNMYPLCAFDDKPLTFYVYRETSGGKTQWEQMTNPDFEQLIKQITARYHVEFLKGWYAKNEALILEDESYYETYIRYYDKISNENNYMKFKKRIYAVMKQSANVKN